MTSILQNIVEQVKQIQSVVTSSATQATQTMTQASTVAQNTATTTYNDTSSYFSYETQEEDDTQDSKNKKTNRTTSSSSSSTTTATKEYTDEEIKASYDEQIAQLNAQGVKTTSLGNGEADFSQYGAALSDELKQEIIDSYDSPEALAMQEELAGLFTNTNVVQTSEFIAAAKQMGYEVSSEYVSTSYIQDNKADGNYDTDVTNGAVNVLTITDPETGTEIKIVDANGNGAIESEELFMNQILEEVSINIDSSNFGTASVSHSSSGGSGSSIASSEGYGEIDTSLFDDNYNETEETDEEKDEDKIESKKSESEEETEKTKTANGRTIVDDLEYKEIEQNTIVEYLEKDGAEYLAVVSDKNASDEAKEEAQSAIDEITAKAQKYVEKHYSTK